MACLPELLEPDRDAKCGVVGVQHGAIVVLAHVEQPAAGGDAVPAAGRVGRRRTAVIVSLYGICTPRYTTLKAWTPRIHGQSTELLPA